MASSALTDEQADAAINEILIRAGHRRPNGPDGARWAAEGPRRVRDLDTLHEWMCRS